MTTNLIDNTTTNDFYVYKTATGTTVSETISQTSDSADSKSFVVIQVAGTTADDPSLKFNVGDTNGFAVGPDNSASDIFKVAIGAGVTPSSGTAALTITTGGTIQKPLQPSFLAYVNANVENITGDGTEYSIIPNTEIFDTNSDYNTGTGQFTAPVTGKYFFQAFVVLYGLTSSHTSGTIFLNTSNIDYNGQWCNPANVIYSGVMGFTGYWLCDMDAADVAYITTDVIGGTKVADLSGGTNGDKYQSYFSGYLEC
jgi:hypothetical protein